jgi:NADPH-dependent 2,4-dienoyl-CoA reductase/sulfur reductase-like enzyme
LKRGVRATAVDTAARRVSFDDGTALDYDRLLIATGSTPADPPIAGIRSEGVHHCWTLKDARAIAERAVKGARVLQMGAGFIGCIIMEALAARDVQLTVVEMGDRMVPRMMGPTAGHMIKDWCEAKGVRVFTGTRVEAIEPGAPLKVRLSSGDVLETDLVINATGVKPNMDFLQGSGVRCLLGVLTDEHLQTSVPGVYAAGDVAEAFDKVSGRTIVSAIQPNAAEQARVAALNMVGRAATLRGVTQINVLDTLGLISASFGDWQGQPGGEHAELTDVRAGRHLSLQFAGERLVGCNAVGWTEHVGAMRGLVEGQIPLGEWKQRLIDDPTQLMAAYLATAQAQSAHALVRA